MYKIIIKKRDRIRNFVQDSYDGLVLVWTLNKKLAAWNLALYVLQAALPIISLFLLKLFIDSIHQSKKYEWDVLIPLIATFGIAQIASVVVNEISSYYTTLHEQTVSDRITKKVLSKSVNCNLEFFERENFSNDLYLAQHESLHRPGQLIRAFQAFVQSCLTVLFFSGFLFLVHWTIPLLLLALSVPLAVSRLLQGYRQYLLDLNCALIERKTSYLFDYLTHYYYAKEIRIFQSGDFFLSSFSQFKKYVFNQGRELHRSFLKYNIGIQFFEIGIILLIYGIIIKSTLITTVSIGGLVTYLTGFQRMQSSISSFYQSCIGMFSQQLYLHIILKFLKLEDKQGQELGTEAFPSQLHRISLKNLHFTYPESHAEALSGVNMTFKTGNLIAIVGENGSGKSTIVKLLCNLYDVEPNTLFINDKDITAIKKESIHQNISVLFQDYNEYYLSLGENIALKEMHDTNTALKKAADKAGLSSIIQNLPERFDTQLGRVFNDGVQLSGGQWQRVALARAYYKDAPVMILDEPTSSLDAAAENLFFRNLKKDIDNTIVILISHHLSNLKMADYIYVLDKGMVVEEGKYEELVNVRGRFFETYKMQLI